MTLPLPLTGDIVIECTSAEASPVTRRAIALAGRIAADLGATVIRIVPRDHELPTPDLQAHDRTVSASEIFLDGGKLTLDMASLDAARPEDRRLLDGAVAILTDPATRAAGLPASPPIRVVIASGAPPRLALPEREVTDDAILALSGLLDLIGHPDSAPVPLGGQQASGLAGLAAFSGLAAALQRLAASGDGDEVHVTALEACLWSNWKSYAERLYMGRSPTRQGALAEWQAVRCRDGFATFIFLEKDWPAVCRMIGDPRLAVPPLDTQAGRRADMGAVYAIVRPWYAARTRAEIQAAARKEGLPISVVLTLDELQRDAQYQAQGVFAPPAHAAPGDAGRVPTLPTTWNGHRFPPRVSAIAAATPMPAQRSSPHSSRHDAGSSAPLAGCRVLDLGIITAGASTSALLADLGADVVKVEASSYIDPFRAWDRGLGAPDWWNRSRFFEFTNRSKRGLALDLKSADGKALFLDLVGKSDVIVENFRRGVLERLGLGWEVLHARNPRLVLCSITSQGEHGPEAGAASYGSTLEANSGLADITRDSGDAPLISGILLNYPDQIVSIYAAGVVALAVGEQRRHGRGARIDISQRELATFLIGDHCLAASTEQPLPTPPRARMERDDRDGWRLRLAGGATVPICNGNDILAAAAAGETGAAFAKTPDGRDVKGAPFRLASTPFAVTRPAPALGEHNAEILRSVLGLDDASIEALVGRGILGTTPKG